MVGDLSFLDYDETEELQELEVPAGELHLKFKLSSGRQMALAALNVVEVMSVTPDQITPMPNVSPLLLGVMNLRGEVIWVADLGQFLGDSRPLHLDRMEVSVVAVTDRKERQLGLAVESVIGMEWLESEVLQDSQDCSEAMQPFVKGEWNLEDAAAPIQLRLLDAVGIIQSDRWTA
ncbi:MAG: chemotaxis protein CheW [Cyanobacteria bacterium J06642_2]